MSSIVLTWVGSLPSAATQAPLNHCSVSGSAPSAMPASSWALSRIFAVALEIAAGVPSDGLVLKPWPIAEAVGVGRHDLDVEGGDAELVGDELRVLRLAAVGVGGQAQHHLAGRVDAQEHRAVGLVSHHRLSSSSWVAAVAARRWRS